MPMSTEDFKALIAQLSVGQLDERMCALGVHMRAADSEREQALEQAPETLRFNELYEPYQWRRTTCLDWNCTGCTGNWQHDAAVMAAYELHSKLDRQMRDTHFGKKYLWDEHNLLTNERYDS